MRYLLILCFISGLNVYGQNDSCLLIRKSPYKITLIQSNHKFYNKFDSNVMYGYEIPYGNSVKCKPWTPKSSQILTVDNKIDKLLGDYKSNTKLDISIKTNLSDIVQNINNYNRQYFCCINDKGEKILYIKFFIKTNDDNINKPDDCWIIVDGGGIGYFDIWYSFDSNKILDLSINDEIKKCT